MKQFGGEVLFLDRSDIKTDEIIPAKYLTENTKQALAPYLLEDLKLEGFNPKTDVPGKKVIITRENFGCGSSREHAPWPLNVNEIYCVIAVSFALIFRQHMYNCCLSYPSPRPRAMQNTRMPCSCCRNRQTNKHYCCSVAV